MSTIAVGSSTIPTTAVGIQSYGDLPLPLSK